MEPRTDPDLSAHARVALRGLSATNGTDEVSRAGRGEALLAAMNQGDARKLASLLTQDVRMTSFDRGEIHEAQGREAVCDRLSKLAEIAASPFLANGTRDAEDALFLWGGNSKSERPGWMITLFFRDRRFFDVRVYLLK